MTRNMNSAQARVVDPILTTHATGYRNAEMIGHILFPVVSIPLRGMLVMRFGKEGFRKMNTRRAPGTRSQRIQYGYASSPVALHQDALEGVVPWEIMEEAAKVPGVNLAKGAVEEVLDVISLGREIQTAKLVLNPNSYGVNNKMALSGSDKWSNPDSDPSKDITEGKEQIRRRIGRYPNLLTLSPADFNALKDHPKIMARFKYTSSDSITVEMLAKYFDVERVVVGRAVYLDENDSDDADAKDVWAGGSVLSYTSKRAEYRSPSFGYTYRLKGHPMVERPYEERAVKSWVYPITEEWSPELTGVDAGFLFQQ